MGVGERIAGYSQPYHEPTEEDAFNVLVTSLFQLVNSKEGRYGYDLYLPDVMRTHVQTIDPSMKQRSNPPINTISPPFYAAAWTLCRRGVLRPGIRSHGEQVTEDGSGGNGYSLTPFGRQWLKESGGRFDYIPTEPGRFAQMLARFVPRFGEGFKERSQDAMRCYDAHAYLACCVMCGAATESVSLAVAIGRGDRPEEVEKEYITAAGRGRIEKRVLGQQTDAVKEEYRGYLTLMKYWRDMAAHGKASRLDDAQAFTSLAMLLRFAHFVDDRWNELTDSRRT
jgi:hypothetical protein